MESGLFYIVSWFKRAISQVLLMLNNFACGQFSNDYV